jgi:hypothetical protein
VKMLVISSNKKEDQSSLSSPQLERLGSFNDAVFLRAVAM